MNLISTKDAANKWGISPRRVVRLASEGRIPGSKQFGTNWLIPDDAKKPADARTKKAKAKAKDEAQGNRPDFFRFPIYTNLAEDDFVPPLSDEEKMLRNAQLAINACRFEEAKIAIIQLSEKASTRYIRIAAIFHCCYFAAFENNLSAFNRNMDLLNEELAKDFPYKKEMELLRYQLYFDSGYYYEPITEGLKIRSNDVYHESSHFVLAYLSLISLFNGDFTLISKLHFNTYEMLCMHMEQSGHFFEAQILHQKLIEIYTIQMNEEMVMHHGRSMLRLAIEHGLYLCPAIDLFYYPDLAKKLLGECPKEFADMISSFGYEIHERFVRFMSMLNDVSYLSLLSEKDFALVSYAVQGYSNKMVANELHMNEKTISKRYNEIYEKLGVRNKQDLIEYIIKNHTM